MLRRSILSLALALAAILALAMPALAGGVVVTLDSTPTDVQAGVPFTVGFMIISAHDGSPQPGFEPIVTATNPATGDSITLTARREGAPGHYVATLTLTSAGEWNWEIQPFGKEAFGYPASVMTPLQVRAPAGQDISAPQVEVAPAESAAQVAPVAQDGQAGQTAQNVPAAQSAPSVESWLALVATVMVAATATIVLIRRRAIVRS